MAVRITADEGVVALFDSTSGIAFGPVFDSAFDAENFLAWTHKERDIEDLRVLPPLAVVGLVKEFSDGPNDREWTD